MKQLAFTKTELAVLERLLLTSTEDGTWSKPYRDVFERLLARVMEARKEE